VLLLLLTMLLVGILLLLWHVHPRVHMAKCSEIRGRAALIKRRVVGQGRSGDGGG